MLPRTGPHALAGGALGFARPRRNDRHARITGDDRRALVDRQADSTGGNLLVFVVQDIDQRVVLVFVAIFVDLAGKGRRGAGQTLITVARHEMIDRDDREAGGEHATDCGTRDRRNHDPRAQARTSSPRGTALNLPEHNLRRESCGPRLATICGGCARPEPPSWSWPRRSPPPRRSRAS